MVLLANGVGLELLGALLELRISLFRVPTTILRASDSWELPPEVQGLFRHEVTGEVVKGLLQVCRRLISSTLYGHPRKQRQRK